MPISLRIMAVKMLEHGNKRLGRMAKSKELGPNLEMEVLYFFLVIAIPMVINSIILMILCFVVSVQFF